MDVIDEQIDTHGQGVPGPDARLRAAATITSSIPIPTGRTTTRWPASSAARKSLGDDNIGAIKFWYEHSLATPAQLAAKKEFEAKVAAQKKKVTDYIAKARGELKEELHSHAADYLAAAALLDADADFSEVQKLAKEKGLRPRYLLTCRQYLARNTEHPFFAKWHELARSRTRRRCRVALRPAVHRSARRAEGRKAKDAKAAKLNDARLDPALDALNDIAGFLAIPDKDADAFDSDWFAALDVDERRWTSMELTANARSARDHGRGRRQRSPRRCRCTSAAAISRSAASASAASRR